ncbi:MAG: hypothetical protein MJE66_09990, partial [Proteobacteria bacterium]|nr:hypothetical protein [Pseudomonadota bacterium]
TALELLAHEPGERMARCDLLIALTESEARSGQRAAAAEHGWQAAEIAQVLDTPERLAKAALAVSPGFFALETGVFDPRLASLLELALAHLEPVDRDGHELRAGLLGRLALCLYWSGRRDQIEHARDRGRVAAARAGTNEAAGHSLVAQHAAHGGPDGAPRRLMIADTIVDHAQRCANAEQALMGRVFRMTALLELGRTGEFDRDLSRFEQDAERHRQPQSFWYVRMYRAMRALMSGQFEESDRLAREYLAFGQRIEDKNVFHCFATHSLLSKAEKTLGDEVTPAVEAHARRYPEYPTWQAGLIWVCAETGRTEQAERLLDEIMDRGLDNFPFDINWLATMSLFANSAWLIGAKRHAPALYARLSPYADRFVTSGFGMVYFGSVEGYLGRLAAMTGRRDEAFGHFERALAAERRLEARPWVVRTQEGLHDALRRFGDAEGARATAREAVHAAESIGMTRVASRLRRSMPEPRPQP